MSDGTRPGEGPERCAGCGLEIAGGTAGCEGLFHELVARDFSDPAYFSVHRMVVDTYSLQHPDRYCKSVKSLAAHLCGLCQILEGEASRAVGDEALRRWLDGSVDVVKPEIPEERGGLTVSDVHAEETVEGYLEGVGAWARSTWRAYEVLHDVAHDWLRRARAR